MDLNHRLLLIISEHFSISPELVKPDSGPKKGDIETWDSFNHITLILRIENEFHVKFKTEEIPVLITPAKLQDRLRAEGVL